MLNNVNVQAAMLAYLKAQASIVALLSSSGEIKEAQWQGTDFEYPAVRVSSDFRPSTLGCGPDEADFTIESFSTQASSLEAATLSATIAGILHKHPFSKDGIKFSTVKVDRIDKPERSIYGWVSQVTVITKVL